MTDTRIDEAALDAKLKALEALEKTINQSYGEGAFMNMAEVSPQLTANAVPTGAISLDIALGIGGLPRGKLVELYGPEGSGKSTLALSVARQVQLLGGTVVYVDAENVLDREYVEALGLDLQRFWIAQPSSGEEGLDIVRKTLEADAADLIVVDSVAALVPLQELRGEIEDLQVGAQARMMSKALRTLVPLANKTNTILIFINQLREKVGQMYGNPETTPGGRALKFFSSIRLDVRAPASKELRDGSGKECTVTVKKNKVGPPGGKATFTIIYGKGIDSRSALVDAAIETGVWFMKGSWIIDAETGVKVAQGKANAAAQLTDEEAEELTDRIYATFRGTATAVSAESVDSVDELDSDDDLADDDDFEAAG